MNSKVGRIELITGPMFAGKTTELLRRIERSELARLNCAVLKYARDDRYSTDNVATHDRKFHAAIPCNELMTHVSE
jgi:thymidine kinase